MKWAGATVSTLARRATSALKCGNCLRAGAIIDLGYVTYGRSGSKPGLKALKVVDKKFERVCVRKHPEGSH